MMKSSFVRDKSTLKLHHVLSRFAHQVSPSKTTRLYLRPHSYFTKVGRRRMILCLTFLEFNLLISLHDVVLIMAQPQTIYPIVCLYLVIRGPKGVRSLRRHTPARCANGQPAQREAAPMYRPHPLPRPFHDLMLPLASCLRYHLTMLARQRKRRDRRRETWVMNNNKQRQ